ncbi:MAG TPA: hypothetical protein DEA43_03440 [Candidatus Moranbacteria bacterium]|nr:hypothetical protein [Candidatus Moranbacteria bacterium]HBT45909.1 hypothetical protein [Candidatus Moranbacteria bacterium]
MTRAINCDKHKYQNNLVNKHNKGGAMTLFKKTALSILAAIIIASILWLFRHEVFAIFTFSLLFIFSLKKYIEACPKCEAWGTSMLPGSRKEDHSRRVCHKCDNSWIQWKYIGY